MMRNDGGKGARTEAVAGFSIRTPAVFILLYKGQRRIQISQLLMLAKSIDHRLHLP